MLEICVESVASAIAAQEGGAQRVELCENLISGGTTPSAGLIEITRKQISIGLHVLIRPRRGDFLYTDLEFQIMQKDIQVAKILGADGVVLGILQADGQIDMQRTQVLQEMAYPMSVTFHRAFDLTPDPYKALDDLLQLGVDRLLTSGQQANSLAGAALLQELGSKAGGRLVVMPGGGVTEETIGELAQQTGLREYHASARSKAGSSMLFRREGLPMGADPFLSEYEFMLADPDRIRAIANAFESRSR